MQTREDHQFKYAAFISYRHGGDEGRWAAWLHRRLESYRIPHGLVATVGKHKLGRIFRDDEELAASSDLSREILEALRASEFLIIVCSPRTAVSEWVNREIQQYRDWGRHEKILTLLIDGEPAQAFPPALRELRVSEVSSELGSVAAVYGHGVIEPLAADVRRLPGTHSRSVRNVALLKLIATMLGVSFDELRQREQVRQVRRRNLLIIAASLLIAMLSGLSVIALVQKSRADHQRQLALHNATEAKRKGAEAESRSNTLLLNSGNEFLNDGDFAQSLPWFLAAMQHEKAYVDRLAIHRMRVESTINHCSKLVYAGTGVNAVLSPDGDTMAVMQRESFQLLSLRSGKPLSPSRDFFDNPRAAFGAVGNRIAVFDETCAIYDVQHDEPLCVLKRGKGRITSVRFMNQDQEVVVTESLRERRFSATSGEQLPWLADLEDRTTTDGSVLRAFASNSQQALLVVAE